MIEIGFGSSSKDIALAPLPFWTAPQELIADALPMLDPPSRISPIDAAEQYMRIEVAGVWQNFDRATAPYLVEPVNVTQSRRFHAVTLIGPSQSGKSKALEVVAMHSVSCDPSPVQVIHMTKTDADAWVEEKLDPTILHSPEILARLGLARDDSTFSRKRFKGMRLTIGYPVASQLSSRTQRLVLLTDYDHMPQLLGGKDNPEGSPFRMARQRIKTFMSRGCVFVESTPAFQVSDATWRTDPNAPHAFPPVTGGIVQIYNEGTRGRWYWECRDCGAEFEPNFRRLVFDNKADPVTAGAGAEMACPDCGALIAHRHKVEMNRAALKEHGGWRHEGRGGVLVSLEDPEIRGTDIASFAVNGTVAAFSTWTDLVSNYINATRKAVDLSDETDLGQFYFTDLGEPFRSNAMTDADDLDVETLKENLGAFKRGIAPAWTRFITVSIDVQKVRFPVQVTAWGARGERVPIDRFDIFTPPAGAPGFGDRILDPARYVEDWAALNYLETAVWPIEGESYGLRAVAIAVDFHGGAGVSDNAEKFWRGRRKAGTGKRWFLSRGHGGFKARDRVWYEAPERGSKGKRARGIKLLNLAVDRLKDSVAAAISRFEPGPGAQHTPAWMEHGELAEFVAEERTGTGWEKKKGVTRNESIDLSVQALGIAIHFGLERINWENPPAWCVLGPSNPYAEKIEADLAAPIAEEKPADPAPHKTKTRRPRVQNINYF